MAALEQDIVDMLFEVLRQKVVVEGYLPDIKLFPDTQSNDPDIVEPAMELWMQAMKDIAADKGFCIDVQGFSSNQYKDDKKVARIVIDVHQFLPSELGNDTSVYYDKFTNPDGSIYYIRKRGVSLLSDLTYSIYALGVNANQVILMNKMIMEVMPHRGYLKPLAEPTLLSSGNFFVRLIDKGRTFELPKGIIERYFVYQMTDLQETGPDTIPGTVPGINDITIDSVVVPPTASSIFN